MTEPAEYPLYEQFRSSTITITLVNESTGVIRMAQAPRVLGRLEMAASAVAVRASRAAIIDPRWRTLPDGRVAIPWLGPDQEAAYKRAEDAALTAVWLEALTWLDERRLKITSPRPDAGGTWYITQS